MRHAAKKYKHLRNLRLAYTSPHEVTNINILIGLDHYYSLTTGETIKGKINEPIAINSVLGWITCGNYQNINSNSSTLCNFFVQTKTSSSQFETKDHETLFGKSVAKVHEYNYDVLFDKHLTDCREREPEHVTKTAYIE